MAEWCLLIKHTIFIIVIIIIRRQLGEIMGLTCEGIMAGEADWIDL